MNYLESITDIELLQKIVMYAESVGRAKNKQMEKMARALLNDAWLEMEKRLTSFNAAQQSQTDGACCANRHIGEDHICVNCGGVA